MGVSSSILYINLSSFFLSLVLDLNHVFVSHLNFSVPPEHSLIVNNKNKYALWPSVAVSGCSFFQAVGHQSMCTLCKGYKETHRAMHMVSEDPLSHLRQHRPMCSPLKASCCFSNLKHLDPSPLSLQTKTDKANCTGLLSLIHHSNAQCSRKTQLSFSPIFYSSFIWHKLY